MRDQSEHLPFLTLSIYPQPSALRGVDLIFVPINITNVHWTLAVIDIPAKKFSFYDSLVVSDQIYTLCRSDPYISDLTLPCLLMH